MKERDEALKKIPPNLEGLVKQIQKASKESQGRMNLMDQTMLTKVDKKEMKTALSEKLDDYLFYRAFPKGTAPKDYLKGMIKEDTDLITERVFELVKHWDIKMVTLRKDMNIEGIYKRLDTMIETYRVNDIVET